VFNSRFPVPSGIPLLASAECPRRYQRIDGIDKPVSGSTRVPLRWTKFGTTRRTIGMPNYSKPEFVLVNYPFSDLTGAKVRPAVSAPGD